MAAVRHLTAAGAFIGLPEAFFDALRDLAADAEAAQRGFQALVEAGGVPAF